MLIRQSSVPLDDDQIAQAAQTNRVYVNAICRQLVDASLIVRTHSGAGKIVNVAAGQDDLAHPQQVSGEAPEMQARRTGHRRWKAERLADPAWLESGSGAFHDTVASRPLLRLLPAPD